MKTLTNAELQLLENLVGVSQESLHLILYKFLKQYYDKVIYDQDFVLAEGSIPIALAAHMDTVFPKPANEVFYDRRKNVMWSPTGAGFDDRAGIFSIIQIVKAGYRPHIIFTTDEEIGCVGATELSYLPCPFKDLRYIIQLDRRNANDCVFYDCDNEEFEKYVESFGFVTAFGSFTDISELCPRWGMAGVNLSIGYRDEHTTSEVLFVGHMLSTIEKVKKMLDETHIPEFKYIPIQNTFDWDTYYQHYYDDRYEDWLYPEVPKGSVHYVCSGCGRKFSEDDVLPVKLIRKGHGYFCADCLAFKADWCHNCGEAFEIDSKHPSEYCSECEKKVTKNGHKRNKKAS